MSKEPDPPAAESTWDRNVFVLLGPDAFARRASVPILEMMIRNGFVPVRHKAQWRRPERLDEFHGSKITSAGDVYLYRLVDMLFDYGPAMALIMQDTSAGGQDSYARLRALKGASDPYDTVPGSIRRDFGAVNVVLSLVHSADTPADSIRESAVFMDGDCASSEAAAISLGRLLSAAVRAETRDFNDVLEGVRTRVIALLWPELAPDQRLLAGKLLTGAQGAASAPGIGRELAQLLPAGPGHPLAALLGCDFDPGADLIDVSAADDMLRGYGARLDAWEKLTLATSQYFRPMRAGLPPGDIPAERVPAG
jgi:nucleoside diphosphate kinase